jgi:hypothetical protein
VELSLMAGYLGVTLLGDEDPALSALLRRVLERRARDSDRGDLARQALSGMPQAIVPFKRDPLDIFLAAGLMKDASRAGLRGQGNAVDAGYFSCAMGEVQYVDTVSRIHRFHAELVDPDATQALVRSLQAWGTRPVVEVGDPAEGVLMRLHPGTSGLPRMDIEPPASARLAERPLQAHINLLRVGVHPSEPHHMADPRVVDPQVNRVAYGQAVFERDANSLVLREAPPEFLMEMHAAALAAQEEGVPLWLSIERGRNEFMSPLPDLMQPGAQSEGWWAPISDIITALGGAHGTAMRVPRWALLRLMQRFQWAWACGREEWVLCAWWLRRRGPGAVYGQNHRRNPVSVPHPAAAATPSTLKRLGTALGLVR